jgi:hypothetical protein
LHGKPPLGFEERLEVPIASPRAGEERNLVIRFPHEETPPCLRHLPRQHDARVVESDQIDGRARADASARQTCAGRPVVRE